VSIFDGTFRSIENIFILATRLITRSNNIYIVTLGTIALISTAVGLIGLRYPELMSLLYGFAPLIGLLFLLVVVTLAYTLLICSVERVFTDDDTPVPKHSRKTKLCFSNYQFSKIALSLSLKEHSPPVNPFPCY
jgi:hypothetical protein